MDEPTQIYVLFIPETLEGHQGQVRVEDWRNPELPLVLNEKRHGDSL